MASGTGMASGVGAGRLGAAIPVAGVDVGRLMSPGSRADGLVKAANERAFGSPNTLDELRGETE